MFLSSLVIVFVSVAIGGILWSKNDDTIHHSPDHGSDQESDWRFTQEVTLEFIKSVRDGKNKQARQNGISDFQWIAIIDCNTCECCKWRNALSTKEIESRLSKVGDPKQNLAIVAPAHDGCRCEMAPIADDMSKVAPPDFRGFDRWLEMKRTAPLSSAKPKQHRKRNARGLTK